MGGDDKFRTDRLLFCIIFFLVLSGGHLLALVVKGNLEANEIRDRLESGDLDPFVRAELETKLDDITTIDFWDILGGFGSILFGLDLILPFAILLTVVNGLLLLQIALLTWSFIKAHIPLISG